ncbi:protein of unknown function [Georgfuchsia toluolica]|uniref:Uncharacterized protein n=1 Tax=Georgfuchsia toluolica TaxID=424218 RepID=A0A916J710_9PROT|nr:protein of unknown function [Georgfuchsia toluolica]
MRLDESAQDHLDIGRSIFTQTVYHSRCQNHMCIGKRAQTHDIYILLNSGRHYLLNRLVSSSVDNLDPGIPESHSYEHNTAIMAIQARLSEQNPFPFTFFHVHRLQVKGSWVPYIHPRPPSKHHKFLHTSHKP